MVNVHHTDAKAQAKSKRNFAEIRTAAVSVSRCSFRTGAIFVGIDRVLGPGCAAQRHLSHSIGISQSKTVGTHFLRAKQYSIARTSVIDCTATSEKFPSNDFRRISCSSATILAARITRRWNHTVSDDFARVSVAAALDGHRKLIANRFYYFCRYSGPGTQLVTQKWQIDWNTYLAGTKDYIVAQIDGRGSSGQGYRLLYEVYRRLGTVEVSDQLEVTEYLRDNLHFIDKRRVGIWGWSYGGYTSTMALANQLSLFQCGVSIAPVVSWKLYGEFYSLSLWVLFWVFKSPRFNVYRTLLEFTERHRQLQGLRGKRFNEIRWSFKRQAISTDSWHCRW